MDNTKGKCFYLAVFLFLATLGLLLFTHYELYKSKELVKNIEYMDSLNNYNKIYYESTFKSLKKENKQLYDSLKDYKNQISYLVQFTHEKEYNTGVVTTKPTIKEKLIHDTVYKENQQIAKTYEYTSEPNDTFQYKLNVNSYTEPNWYSIRAKVKNKFTIVNKEENGMNHITIEPNDGGNVSSVTVFKKKEKKTFLERFSIGPGVTAGYDPINKKFGVVVGATASFDLK